MSKKSATCCSLISAAIRPRSYPNSNRRHNLTHNPGLQQQRSSPGSSQYRLRFGDASARTSGMVIGIVGSASLVTGVLLATALVMSAGCHIEECRNDGPPPELALGTLALGAVLTPIGWGVFLGNRTHLDRLGDAPAPAASAEVFRVGVGGVASGGLGLSAQARF